LIDLRRGKVAAGCGLKSICCKMDSIYRIQVGK
jgi:hypothetical protein